MVLGSVVLDVCAGLAIVSFAVGLVSVPFGIGALVGMGMDRFDGHPRSRIKFAVAVTPLLAAAVCVGALGVGAVAG